MPSAPPADARRIGDFSAAQPAGDQRRALVGPLETGADHLRTRRRRPVTCASHQYTRIAQPINDAGEDPGLIQRMRDEQHRCVIFGLQDPRSRAAAGVVLCRDAQQQECAVGRQAVDGGLDLFLMNRPVAPSSAARRAHPLTSSISISSGFLLRSTASALLSVVGPPPSGKSEYRHCKAQPEREGHETRSESGRLALTRRRFGRSSGSRAGSI